jgi:hypothetical protein
VGEAAKRASERVGERGLPPLPHTTPHTLRRDYISIALLANRFDVLCVMGQVGHADSKMTLDVYAQLPRRHQSPLRPRGRLGGADAPREERSASRNRATCRRIPEWRDPDSNRGHHDFQGVAEMAREG